MIPIDFAESNFTWKGDGDQISDLPVLKTPLGSYSCWRLSAEDIRTLLETGCIWVGIGGTAHPPVLITVNEPTEIMMERKMHALPVDMQMRLDIPT